MSSRELSIYHIRPKVKSLFGLFTTGFTSHAQSSTELPTFESWYKESTGLQLSYLLGQFIKLLLKDLFII
jgi:hypothetical protein